MKVRFKEIFNLAVRLVGLVFLYRGVTGCIESPSLNGVILGVGYFVPAVWLLRGGYPIAQWAYPEAESSETRAQAAPVACFEKPQA
jgi:hypothetical protein